MLTRSVVRNRACRSVEPVRGPIMNSRDEYRSINDHTRARARVLNRQFSLRYATQVPMTVSIIANHSGAIRHWRYAASSLENARVD